MASATGSIPPLPPDPLRLRRRLALQGGGFALLLLAAFSTTLYWGIASQRAEDQRTELRQLAASAAAQLPLIVHETREPEGSAKFRPDARVIASASLDQQRLQWFDASGVLLSDQGSLPLPLPLPPQPPLPLPTAPPPQALQAARASGGGSIGAGSRAAAASAGSGPVWQRWAGGLSLWLPVDSQRTKPLGGRPGANSTAGATGVAAGSSPNSGNQLVSGATGMAAGVIRLGYVRVAISDQAARADLERLRRGLLLGGIVTALAALLVGRRMLAAAFLPLHHQIGALQRFTADTSHELRHPLTALRTLLAAVPEELRQRPELAWRELDGLSRRLGEQLDDLLFLARQQQAGLEGPLAAADLQRFDLLELLEDLLRCYSPQAAAAAVSLQLSPDPADHSLPIHGQSEALLRLFTNLLLNAIRHSPEGGTVSVEVRRLGRRLRIAVADQGPGIPAQAREQVFERFWSGSDRGGHSGLGLAIGRAIARRHGGELRLGESRPGCCELVVELPSP
jgi:signal transduction histidine kinase